MLLFLTMVQPLQPNPRKNGNVSFWICTFLPLTHIHIPSTQLTTWLLPSYYRTLNPYPYQHPYPYNHTVVKKRLSRHRPIPLTPSLSFVPGLYCPLPSSSSPFSLSTPLLSLPSPSLPYPPLPFLPHFPKCELLQHHIRHRILH